jgi:pimeloyl-ACP methyl ester carboxylesterase
MNGIASSPDGIALAYEVHGEGTPALVFVHGWSCDRSYWRNQLGHFAQGFRVVALDLAGHGDSGAGRSEWAMSSFGRDVAAVVDQLNLEDAVLIGHSMGVDVVVEAALELPGRVRGLVLVDQYASLGQPRTRERTRALVAPFLEDFASTTRSLVREMFVPSSPADLIEWVIEDMAAAPEDVALGALEQTWSNDGPILESLPKVAAPIVAINSDMRPTNVEALERYGIRTLIAPGVGHFLMLEDPDTFNRLLGEAIAGFKPSALPQRPV